MPKTKDTPHKVLQVYCANPSCPNHVTPITCVSGDAPVAGDIYCPRGHTEPVVAVPVDSVPLSDADYVLHKVLVLPGKPYGGFVLQLGDDDTTSTWEGGTTTPLVAKPPSDPSHEGARYVAELQRDLIQLGYLTQGRWLARKDAPPHLLFDSGKFSISVLSAIHLLKSDLAEPQSANGFGVSIAEWLEGEPVLSGATASPKSPPFDSPFPIFYKRIPNPRFITIETKEWNHFITDVPKTARTWQAIKAKGNAEAVAALFETIDDAGKTLLAGADAVLTKVSPLTITSITRHGTNDWGLDSDRAERAKEVLAQMQRHHSDLEKIVKNQAETGQGDIVQFRVLVDDILATIDATPAYSGALGPERTQALRADAAAVHAKLAALSAALKDDHSDLALAQYRNDFRDFARVDQATAFCIKKMIAERQLNGRRCWVAPEAHEILLSTFEGKTYGLHPLRADRAFCERLMRDAAQRALHDFPADKIAYTVLYAMLFNESGWTVYGFSFEGFRYVTMGIDANNDGADGKTGPQTFDEFGVKAPAFGFNRGWSIGQNSPGNESGYDRSFGYAKRIAGNASEDHTGEQAAFQFRDGLPIPIDDEKAWPASLVVPQAALAFAMHHIKDKFVSSRKKLPCSYPSKDAPSFECQACLSRFGLSDFTTTEKLESSPILGDFVYQRRLNDQILQQYLKDHPGASAASVAASKDFADYRNQRLGADVAEDDRVARDAAAKALADRKAKGDADVPTLEEFVKTDVYRNEFLPKAHQRRVDQWFIENNDDKKKHKRLRIFKYDITSALTVEAYARVINPKGFQDPEDLVELPCSWLAARAFYAGRTPLGLTHVPEVVKLVQDLT